MSIKARIFGNAVKGKTLRDILTFIGENPDSIMSTPSRGGRQGSVAYDAGWCKMTPKRNGIYIDLHLKPREQHPLVYRYDIEKLRPYFEGTACDCFQTNLTETRK